VLQEGSREDVFYRPSTRKVAELVGTRNIVAATVVAVEGESLDLQWNQLRLEARNSGAGLHVGQKVDMCIRPTQIMIRRPEDTTFEERANVLHGTIVDEVTNAETHRLFVRLAGSMNQSDLEIELPGNTYFRLGLDHKKDIQMSIRSELLHVIPRRTCPTADSAGPRPRPGAAAPSLQRRPG
jgi:molybdate transport system ATP-binding protein